jgi:diaminopimelate decarboxylase
LNSDSPEPAASVRGGRLQLEDCDLTELAEDFGTPTFVLSAERIRENYTRLERAFSERWPEGKVRVLPAFKAAPYLAIRQLLSQLGAGCDTFGESELEGAVRGGTDPSLISVNGSIKSHQVIRRGIELGARIVIDAPRELEICSAEARRLGKAARVLFRIKPELVGLDVESDFAPVPVGELTARVRYGLPTSEALPLGPLAAADDGIEVLGFHAHVGRQSTDMKLWDILVRATVALADELRRAWQWSDWAPQILDFGGGFAPPRNYDTDHHRTGEPAPPIETYAETMTRALRESLAEHGIPAEGLVLEMEPGRGLHSDTGVHLTRVTNIKNDTGAAPRTWLEVDTSEQFLGTYAMDPAQHPFLFRVANRPEEPPTQTVDIVGKSCGGEMLLLDAEVPEVQVGDIIALEDTGAYIESLACNFNALPRPGTLLVSGNCAEWIRRPETIEEVYARDIIPSALLENKPTRSGG